MARVMYRPLLVPFIGNDAELLDQARVSSPDHDRRAYKQHKPGQRMVDASAENVEQDQNPADDCHYQKYPQRGQICVRLRVAGAVEQAAAREEQVIHRQPVTPRFQEEHRGHQNRQVGLHSRRELRSIAKEFDALISIMQSSRGYGSHR